MIQIDSVVPRDFPLISGWWYLVTAWRHTTPYIIPSYACTLGIPKALTVSHRRGFAYLVDPLDSQRLSLEAGTVAHRRWCWCCWVSNIYSCCYSVVADWYIVVAVFVVVDWCWLSLILGVDRRWLLVLMLLCHLPTMITTNNNHNNRL